MPYPPPPFTCPTHTVNAGLRCSLARPQSWRKKLRRTVQGFVLLQRLWRRRVHVRLLNTKHKKQANADAYAQRDIERHRRLERKLQVRPPLAHRVATFFAVFPLYDVVSRHRCLLPHGYRTLLEMLFKLIKWCEIMRIRHSRRCGVFLQGTSASTTKKPNTRPRPKFRPCFVGANAGRSSP